MLLGEDDEGGARGPEARRRVHPALERAPREGPRVLGLVAVVDDRRAAAREGQRGQRVGLVGVDHRRPSSWSARRTAKAKARYSRSFSAAAEALLLPVGEAGPDAGVAHALGPGHLRRAHGGAGDHPHAEARLVEEPDRVLGRRVEVGVGVEDDEQRRLQAGLPRIASTIRSAARPSP